MACDIHRGLLKNGLVQRTSDSGLETAADEREG
jgi:hypothetical protein